MLNSLHIDALLTAVDLSKWTVDSAEFTSVVCEFAVQTGFARRVMERLH